MGRRGERPPVHRFQRFESCRQRLLGARPHLQQDKQEQGGAQPFGQPDIPYLAVVHRKRAGQVAGAGLHQPRCATQDRLRRVQFVVAGDGKQIAHLQRSGKNLYQVPQPAGGYGTARHVVQPRQAGKHELDNPRDRQHFGAVVAVQGFPDRQRSIEK